MSNFYNIKKQSLILLFTLLISGVFYGQNSGTLDTTFNSQDRGSVAGVNNSIDNLNDDANIRSISTQSNGKVIIFGTFGKYDNIINPLIARLNPTDGSLDTTFSQLTSINGNIYSVTVLPDDKILLTGDFTELNGATRNSIAKLNSNGTLDTSFDTGNNTSSLIYGAKVQNDGKILIYGSFTSISGVSRNSLARLNADGTLDTTFNVGSGVVYGINEEQILDLIIQPDGKIIICGTFLTYNGSPSRCLARLNTDGSIDSSFNIGTGANLLISKIAYQSDGKIIISGDFSSYNGIAVNRLARLNTNGSLDNSFSIGSGVTSASFIPAILDITIQSDNKILLSGGLETINGVSKSKIVRLNPDGSIDNSFNIGTGFLQNTSYTSVWGMYSMKILNNNKILVGGGCAFYNGTIRKSIALLNTDGSLDNVFNASYGADAWVLDSKVLNDGKILIAGSFNTYYQTPKSKIAKLYSNGTIDNSFNPPSVPNTFIRSFAIQNDDKILITRNSSTLVGGIFVETAKIERLNSDGTLDNTFDTNLGANNTISKVIFDNNKIYAIGNFTTYNGISSNRIIRLNLDGSIDSSFNVGIGPNLGVLDLLILNDGKILICGNFDSINGVTRRRIARLNNNGTLDISFNGPFLSNSVNSIAIQNDGKIILGSFLGLKRLNANGSNDSSFSANIPGLTIFKVVVLSDGKIIAGGLHDGEENRFLKFNSDGSINTDFDSEIGIIDGIISTISAQSDGKIIVGGNFRAYGVSKDRIIRVNNTTETLSSITYSNKEFLYYPNPTKNIVNIQSKNQIINRIEVFDFNGRIIKKVTVNNKNYPLNIEDVSNGIYLLKVYSDKGNQTFKIIKE
jgi:uncharacterized delta-60 repeat protein